MQNEFSSPVCFQPHISYAMASTKALIVVDMQHDFCSPDGSLSVKDALQILPLVNKLLSSDAFAIKVATKDWHPQNHISFASNHPAPNNKPFESFIEMTNLVANKPHETMQQRLWPDHCVQGSKGAELLPDLDRSKIDLIVEKGMDERVEMYSGFSDSFGNLTAGKGGVSHDLAQILREKGVTEVYCVGIAGDYCVNYTALDAAKAGFKTYVIEEGQKCVDSGMWPQIKDGFKAGKVEVVNEHSEQVKQLISR